MSFYRQPGKILLIASNRAPAPKTIKVKLDLAQLGLPEKPAVKPLDSGYEPPAGEDFRPGEKPKIADAKAVTDLMGPGGEAGVGAEVDEILTEDKKENLNPRFEGGVLLLPTRARDFRMVTIQAP